MVHLPPRPASTASSNRNCGTCVDFPQPVSPQIMTVRWSRTCASTSSRKDDIGRALRADRILSKGPPADSSLS
eukprot:scaffold85080_cov31-Tisochrysis_lutea.AAC.10